MTENCKEAVCLGVYRAHEGTIYSLDVKFKSGIVDTDPSKPRRNYSITSIVTTESKKVAPDCHEIENLILATGSHDNSTIIWDVSSDRSSAGTTVKVEQSKRLKGHTGDVYAIELFSGENLHRYGTLISGGDFTLRTWKVENGLMNAMFSGHTGYISCLKVHGRRVFSGSWDTTVRSWNLDTGKAMHVFKGHKNIVNCVDVIDSDIFSGSWDQTIIQWSRATGGPVHIYRGHSDGVQCLKYYQDSLISGSMDKTIKVWNTSTGKCTKTLRGHEGGVECLFVSAGKVFSGSYDKTVRCFKLDTGECIGIFVGHTDGIYCLKVMNNILFTGSGDKSLRLWDAEVFRNRCY